MMRVSAVVVCFSFALIDFSLKRFLSLFDCSVMPAALSRFGTLGEFGTVVEDSFGSLADC